MLWAPAGHCQLPDVPAPLPVKVVIVTMFENGRDSGDTPGEFQAWVEREALTTVYPMPQAYHAVRGNADGVIGIVTGIGTAKAAASVMALGLDPRFDLSKAYWIVAGIAGIDPADGSLGSAAWAKWVVDADLAHEIDAREIPPGWTTGIMPLQKERPYQGPVRNRGEAYQLNPDLCDWAYRMTKDVPLRDSERMKAFRARFAGFPNAQKPPFVLQGDTLSGSTFWHGALMNRWANEWVKYWSYDQANYVTTAMEDSGTMQALTFLASAKKVDLNRVMVLRTASDYDSPPPDMSAAQSLKRGEGGSYYAYNEALRSAYDVGSVVVHEIVNGWERYKDKPPAPPKAP